MRLRNIIFAYIPVFTCHLPKRLINARVKRVFKSDVCYLVTTGVHDLMYYKVVFLSEGIQKLQAPYSHREAHSSFGKLQKAPLGGVQTN